ncbi:MAG: TonB-dependent receptor [Bacteroidaceae bacterium]|nr:TonB-dependent receptor [Bacteroidaceae bacterium]
MRDCKNNLVLLVTIMLAQMVSAQINDSITLDNIVVTGTRHETDVRHLPMTVTSLSNKKLTEQHRTSILPTLNEQVPGLFTTSRSMFGYGVSNGAAGAFTVRGIGGSSPNAGVLILIDGMPQYAGLYGHSIADAYQTMIAERVEVLRGPASTLYGSNAMGGVVNIVTRKMQQDGTKTNVRLAAGSYGTVQGELTQRLRKGKFISIIGVNYGRTDGHRPDNTFKQYAGFLKLGYDFNQHWQAMGDVNLIHFNSENPGETNNPLIDNDQQVTRGMASVGITNRYENTSGAIRTYYNWGHHQVNDGYNTGGTPRTSFYMHDDLMAGISIYQTFSLFGGNRTTIGADWTHFGGHAWNEDRISHAESLIADKTEDEMAAYVDIQQTLTDWLSLNAGLRVDHHTQVGTELVPQGGLAFNLPNEIALKAMVSKGFRNPTMREMYMYPPQNPNLKPERTLNYEIGYKQTLAGGDLHVGANLFYITGENLIMLLRENGKPLNTNVDKVENYGLELSTDYKISTRWQMNANYSFLHMKYPVIAAPEHKAYLGVHAHYDSFSFTTGLQYIAGLHTTVGENGKKEEFLLWNLTANYRLGTNLTLFVKGENLLGQCYEVNYGFPMPKATFMGGISLEL